MISNEITAILNLNDKKKARQQLQQILSFAVSYGIEMLNRHGPDEEAEQILAEIAETYNKCRSFRWDR